MKTCKICKLTKDLKEFNRTGQYYRNFCKPCHNAKYQAATGKPNTGRFVKGHKPENGFKKGNIPWNHDGGSYTPEMRQRMSAAQKTANRKMSEYQLQRIRESSKLRWQSHNYNKTRWAWLSRQWSIKVRKRDGKCHECGSMERLEAHHIASWRDNESLRFEVNNGITYCRLCHIEQHRNDIKIPWNKGKPMTTEHKRKLSESHKGKIPWNKGIRSVVTHGNE